MRACPATFRITDLSRALKAAAKAGERVTAAEIGPDGKIKLIFGGGADGAASPLDDWRARRG
jgi:hypothetical protein